MVLAAGCEGTQAPAAASAAPAVASRSADAAGDVAPDVTLPEGGECTVDTDCSEGAWCARGYCRECDLDVDCDDGVSCTQDRCSAEGRCSSEWLDGCCAVDATPEQLAASCGAPPAGVAPEEYWICTPTGECAVQGVMSPLAPPPVAIPAGPAVSGDPEGAPEAGDAPAQAPHAATETLPAPPVGALAPESWVQLVGCSGCLNPGGMNKRINGSMCTDDIYCLSGSCAGGVCEAWKSAGAACDWQDECTSGFCADGYCCDTACDGACDYCALAGQEGTCGNGCQLDAWRSEVQSGAIYAESAAQDLAMLVNVGWHPGGRTVPGGLDTHVIDWGIINADYGLCMGGPIPELCDDRDNDCDGATDEDWNTGPGILGEPCTVGAGATCEAHGYWVCPEGGLGVEPVCSAQAFGAEDEICNDIDDDCDGDTDESLSQDCASDCGTGTETCAAGAWVGCTAPTPADFPTYGDACDGDDLDSCPNGALGCVAGEGFVCIEDPLGTIAEDCSTPEDDDCDGDFNDQDAVGCVDFWTDTDGDGFGVGTPSCFCEASGLFRAPEPDDCNDGDDTIYPGAPEPCNGVDNDCDSVADDLEPDGEMGAASFRDGVASPDHPCAGATSTGGSDCDTSSCICGPNVGAVWGCYLD
ncbi:MAG: hypothetical protein H6744_13355 [Deltaproteobacteria bacterium]|nr:hypothetical protein [Deltaproteobacteria bacterium]